VAPPNQTQRRIWFLAAVVVVAIVVAAAIFGSWLGGGGDDAQPVARIHQWVAVLDVGPDARSLYPAASDVGKVAGVYVFVDRWACYEGFPAGSQPSKDEWFLGVAAADRQTVDGIVAALGRTPIVEAQVEQGCALPPDTTPVGSVS